MWGLPLQNFGVDISVKPPEPYTGEHITFVIRVMNTTKGYKGAKVGWEVSAPPPSISLSLTLLLPLSYPLSCPLLPSLTLSGTLSLTLLSLTKVSLVGCFGHMLIGGICAKTGKLGQKLLTRR